MVAVVNPGKSLRHALHYNENKLKEKKAELFHAKGFAKDIDRLGFTDKIRRFEKLTELSEIKVNAVHISLNFDPSEKLDKDTLTKIADAYMRKIGFGDQPYLVYQHHDAGHPHIHIVTTNVKADGDYIRLHNIGRNQSSTARREIEREFNLVRAEREQEKQVYSIKPINAQKVQYGRSETKRAMTNVLDAVLDKYKYTSLPELNAVLRSYNMVADHGTKQSRVYQNKGLVYRVLDERGEKVGVPIKASDFYSKPTLAYLEERFTKNEKLRQPHKLRIKNAVDFAIATRPGCSLSELSDALQKEKIQLVVRRNESGVVYGLTYIDHHTKCVFNGSDLDKKYAAKLLLQRLGQEQLQQAAQRPQQEAVLKPEAAPARQQTQQQKTAGENTPKQQQKHAATDPTGGAATAKILPETTTPQQQAASLNPALKEDRKKKRKKRLRH